MAAAYVTSFGIPSGSRRGCGFEQSSRSGKRLSFALSRMYIGRLVLAVGKIALAVAQKSWKSHDVCWLVLERIVRIEGNSHGISAVNFRKGVVVQSEAARSNRTSSFLA